MNKNFCRFCLIFLLSAVLVFFVCAEPVFARNNCRLAPGGTSCEGECEGLEEECKLVRRDLGYGCECAKPCKVTMIGDSLKCAGDCRSEGGSCGFYEEDSEVLCGCVDDCRRCNPGAPASSGQRCEGSCVSPPGQIRRSCIPENDGSCKCSTNCHLLSNTSTIFATIPPASCGANDGDCVFAKEDCISSLRSSCEVNDLYSLDPNSVQLWNPSNLECPSNSPPPLIEVSCLEAKLPGVSSLPPPPFPWPNWLPTPPMLPDACVINCAANCCEK